MTRSLHPCEERFIMPDHHTCCLSTICRWPVWTGPATSPPTRALSLRYFHLTNSIKMYYLVFCPLTKRFYSSHNEFDKHSGFCNGRKTEPLKCHTCLRNVIKNCLPLKSQHDGRGQMTKRVFEELPESK